MTPFNPLASRDTAVAALAKASVCVVDDDQDQLDILRGYLEPLVAEFHAFDQAETALRHIGEQAVSLALVDVMMPGLDGWSLYARIRETPGCETLPVIFVTCLADLESEPEMREAKLCATLRKPVDRDQLIAHMARLLEG